mgnify:CR=1 FL=1
MQKFQELVQLRDLGMEQTLPDAYTYEIMLLALGRRLSATKTACKFVVEDMMRSSGYSPRTLMATFDICKENANKELAQRVLNKVVSDDSRAFRLPNQVYSSYLRILIPDGEYEKSLEVLRTCLRENHRRHDKFVDDVFNIALTWPMRNKATAPQFLQAVNDILEGDSRYFPGKALQGCESLSFRREYKIRFIYAIKKWFTANVISSTKYLLFLFIPNSKCKRTKQMLDALFSPFLIGFKQ